ncbi:TonB-dependent receptor [Salmonella enterica subsp. enterica]|nr:TonB-dependent receptor [Salmonella enterica]EDT8776245.1 TonB-dependent receptor [Salmonella enterica subsp. enterica serovar Panama]EKC4582601.1 TonB-dependent receptor [Salmonella enterica subsp. enterica]HCZ5477807.1 TonB-dependent receptor [Salmonella enterica subsp. enterica serovar Anatum str. CFSAN003938]EBD6412038.1 TonB-dependent receptor [Salmonella enterica]
MIKKILTVTLGCFSLPGIAAGNTDAEDSMVVTASGYEQKITDAAASVSVISRQELERKNYTDLGQALNGIEGVDVQSSTGKTGGLDISIRGMPSNYTLILIDGIRQNVSGDVTPNGFGTMNTSFMPPLSAIDHIEIIRGPMSTLYGSDAIGGVVNIITRKTPEHWSTSINASQNFQEHNKWGNASTLGFWTGGPLMDKKLSLSLRGNTLYRQGSSITSLNENANTRTPFPTQENNYNVGGRLALSLSESNEIWLDTDIARQRYDNSKGQLGPVGTRGGGYENVVRYQRNRFTVGHDTTFSAGTWKSTVTYNETSNRGRLLVPGSLVRNKRDHTGEPRELKNTNTIVDSTFLLPVGDSHLLTMGGEYQDARMKDGVVMINTGDYFRQKSWSLYGEDDWQLLEPLTLTYGARYEKHDAFGGHISPRAYLVWDSTDHITVKGGVSTGYRTPNLSQLHDGISGVTGQGTINTVGNPQLKPESSTSTEMGVYFDDGNGLSANITGFYTHFSNKIISREIDNVTRSYINSGKARTDGVELAAGIPLWSQDWRMNVNYTFTDSRQLDGENKGAPLSYTPKHVANIRLDWQTTPDIMAWLKIQYRGKSPRFTQTYSHLTPVQKAVYDARGESLKASTVADIGASWKAMKNLTFSAMVNNILDKDFSGVETYKSGNQTTYAGDYFQTAASTTGYVIPGRNFWLSASYEF